MSETTYYTIAKAGKLVYLDIESRSKADCCKSYFNAQREQIKSIIGHYPTLTKNSDDWRLLKGKSYGITPLKILTAVAHNAEIARAVDAETERCVKAIRKKKPAEILRALERGETKQYARGYGDGYSHAIKALEAKDET